jgi:hypothetical protein
MNALRMLCFAVSCCLALAACDHEPVFDASTLPAYQKSLGKINASLGAAAQDRLKIALAVLALGGVDRYIAFGRNSPSNDPSFEMLDGSIINAMLYFEQMRSQIDGKTAAAVISRVAEDFDVAIARVEARGGDSGKVFKAFVIENTQFYWDRSHGRDRDVPMARFSIYNGSTVAVSNIQLNGTLTVPGDTTPVAISGLFANFTRPLQPGAEEMQTVRLATVGEAVTKRLANTYNANLTLQVTNIGDTAGKRLFSADAEWLDAVRHKRDALRGG